MKHRFRVKHIYIISGAALLLYCTAMLFIANLNAGLFVLYAAAAFMILYGAFYDRIKFHKAVDICVCVGLVFFLAFSSVLAIYGSIETADGTESAVIVLGSGIRGEQVSKNLAKRLDKAVEYCQTNTKAIIIVSGGKGEDEQISEAEAMKRYLISKGVDEDRIILEDKSTSTLENFRFSYEKLEALGVENERTVFITNKFHIYRAEKTALSAGFKVSYIGAKTVWYNIAMNYTREILAVTKYSLARFGG